MISRRGRIIQLLDKGITDSEILALIDIEFPPGTFESSNIDALRGTKWDLGTKSTNRIETPPEHSRSLKQSNPLTSLSHDELVKTLRAFDPEPVIDNYRQEWAGMTPNEILRRAVDKSIYRAFHTKRQINHQAPTLRYMQWRYHRIAQQLLSELQLIQNQEDFDKFVLVLGESLVEDWGERNEHHALTGMNIGVAMKIANLVCKHLSFSPYCHNQPMLTQWLHVPWDSYTLTPLRGFWPGSVPIPNSPSQGFVNSLSLYRELHLFITGISQEAKTARIIYEFWAYDRPR